MLHSVLCTDISRTLAAMNPSNSRCNSERGRVAFHGAAMALNQDRQFRRSSLPMDFRANRDTQFVVAPTLPIIETATTAAVQSAERHARHCESTEMMIRDCVSPKKHADSSVARRAPASRWRRAGRRIEAALCERDRQSAFGAIVRALHQAGADQLTQAFCTAISRARSSRGGSPPFAHGRP